MWEEVDELEWPTHYHERTTDAVFQWHEGMLPEYLARRSSMDTCTLLERLLAGWKISTIPKGEIGTKRKDPSF
jgi:hypothetical protein